MLYFIIGTAFIFLLTSLGSIAVLFVNKKKKINLNIFLSFAGGIMLSASIFSLLLPALEYEKLTKNQNLLYVTIGIILGALIILIFDIFLLINNKKEVKYKKLYVAMTIHNIPEGLAVGLSFGLAFIANNSGGQLIALLLAFGIGIQNIPEGAATSLSMYNANNSKLKSILLSIASGSVEIIGSLLGFLFAIYIANFLPLILSIGAGSMLYVVIDEVIINKDENNIKNNVSFLFGFLLMMILDIILG